MKPINRKNCEKHALQPLQNEMNSLFKRFTDDPFFSFPNLIHSNSDSFFPAMNIEETSDRYKIELEVPGVDPSSVDIELNGNVIVIKGEKTHKHEKTDEETKLHVIEHNYGSFYRSFPLPDNIDSKNITAENKNGMLYIEVPKDKSSKSQKIVVKNITNK